MSIVNAWVLPDRALVGVDTERGSLNSTTISQCSKMVPLPHINGILAGAGHCLFFGMCVGVCVNEGGDFDQLVEKIPAELPRIFGQFVAGLRSLGGESFLADAAHQQLIFVGWSRKLRRFAGWEYLQERRMAGFKCDAIEPGSICPWHESLPELPDPKTPEAMLALARAQKEMAGEQFPGRAIGGRFIVAELTAGGMSIREIGRLSEEAIERKTAICGVNL